MAHETGADSGTRRGRPAQHDAIALLACVSPGVDQSPTLDAACEGGLSFLDRPKISADKNAVTYRKRCLSQDTLKRQFGKARASLTIDAAELVPHIPEEAVQEMVQQLLVNARSTWGGKPELPEGFMPTRKLKPGRPPKNSAAYI